MMLIEQEDSFLPVLWMFLLWLACNCYKRYYSMFEKEIEALNDAYKSYNLNYNKVRENEEEFAKCVDALGKKLDTDKRKSLQEIEER